MKKKFIRVMFFGALALATGASFVGCKDYDDDIDAVNARVDGIEKTLSELQAQVGGYVKSVVYDPVTGKLTVVGADTKEYTIPMPKEMPEYSLEVTKEGKVILKKNGTEVSSGNITFPDDPVIPTYEEFDPAKLTMNDKGEVLYNGKKTGVTIPATPTPTSSIVAIKNAEGVVTGYTITTIEDGKPVNGTFSIVDAVPLKGLTFAPSCFVGGIPSLKASNLTYNKWNAQKYDAPTETGEIYKVADTESYITPQIWAYYHMNPASASMDQIETLAFLSADKDYYPVSRAAEMNPIANKAKSKVETEKDGQRYLKVAMDADAEKIPAMNSGKVAVYALQAKTKAIGGEEAKVITSDYASVYRVVMKDFVLKTLVGTDNKVLYGQTTPRTGTTPNALAGKAEEAITAAEDYTVATDGKLELAKLITTYYKENGGTELIKMENVEDYGLKYVFTPSNYIGGANNEIEQNTFFNAADAALGTINPEYKGQDSEATENREPLLRVELVDIATNQVVAVGWIKTKIVKGTTDGFPVEFNKGTYYYGCDKFDKSLSYIDMNDVYAKAKLNKTEFHNAYKLKVDGSGNIVLGTGSTGVVKEIKDDPATATNVLNWVVTPAQALALVKASKAEMFANVTYESVDGTRGDITITMKAGIAMPNGVIKNDQKITQAWSADKSYVKADVKEPVTTAVTDFKLDLFDVFEGRKVVVSDVNDTNFPSFAKDKLTAKFIFSGANVVTIGTDKYTFTVTANGTQLNASKNGAAATKIATIDAKGIITYNKVDKNAQTLLNKSAYNVDPFTAGIEIVVTNECDEILPLTGNKFDVKFLRPINVVDLKSAELKDATTGTAKIDMSKLLGLTDWRGEAFAVEPIDFYTYYGIEGATAISIDKDKIMTTLNASEAAPKLLKDVAPNMSIDYACDLKKSGNDITYGDLVYANGKFTINAPFKLFIPVTVKYTFGEVTSTVTLTITPTHD